MDGFAYLDKTTLLPYTKEDPLPYLKELPPAVYELAEIPKIGPAFRVAESFNPPEKVYGDMSTNVQRIANTFESRNCSTGVMLIGDKGSGKTVMTKLISGELVKRGVPSLIINSPMSGTVLGPLLASIHQPLVVMFDEFEKKYKENDQEGLLTVLDGLYSSKKMFLFTVNEKHDLSSYLRDRPGRIFYWIDFDGLPHNVVSDYVTKEMKHEEFRLPTIELINSIPTMNFDIMKAVVEEVDRYKQSPAKLIGMMNISPPHEGGGMSYRVIVFYKGEVAQVKTYGLTPTSRNHPVKVVFNDGLDVTNLIDARLKEKGSTGSTPSLVPDVSLFKDHPLNDREILALRRSGFTPKEDAWANTLNSELAKLKTLSGRSEEASNLNNPTSFYSSPVKSPPAPSVTFQKEDIIARQPEDGIFVYQKGDYVMHAIPARHLSLDLNNQTWGD